LAIAAETALCIYSQCPQIGTVSYRLTPKRVARVCQRKLRFFFIHVAV